MTTLLQPPAVGLISTGGLLLRTPHIEAALVRQDDCRPAASGQAGQPVGAG